jgi:hypothetical protein
MHKTILQTMQQPVEKLVRSGAVDLSPSYIPMGYNAEWAGEAAKIREGREESM